VVNSCQKDAKLDAEVGDLHFRLLGPLEAERGGIRLELGPRKQRAVLALLLLEANRVVPTERLIDELWGDAPPETARSALQVYVAGLRKALGEDGASLRTQAPGYVLDLEPGALDLDAFTALRAEARDAPEPARAADALHEALALWRGAPLAELDGAPFGTAARAQLEEQRLGALEDRIDADLALGRHAELIHELDALVAEHPYRERFRAQQMLALYRSGRQADALAAYRSARETFVEGLGIEPGAELKLLERQVLDHDPALAAPAPVSTTVAEAPARRRLPILAVALVTLVGAAVAAALLVGGEPAALTVEPNWVAVIDPKTNDVVKTVPAGVEPGPITFGGGAVWVGNLAGKSVTRIDPASRTFVETIPLDRTPTGVAFGHGKLWVAHGHTGQVTWIDPELGGRETIDDVAKTRFGSTAGAVDAGATDVWAVFGDATLARVDPTSSDVEPTDVGVRPTGVVEGGDWLWVVSSGNKTVYRFSPDTFLAGPLHRFSVGRGSTGIAYGRGAVWVTSSGDDFVTRGDPDTSGVSTRQIEVGDRPEGVAVGAGAVWVANAGAGTVSRIDPATTKVVNTIEVGNRPFGVVVAAGLVWVTVQAP
jgi:YVTN family beta-propeller protein